MDHLLEVPELIQYNSNGEHSSVIYSMGEIISFDDNLERISDRIKFYCNHKLRSRIFQKNSLVVKRIILIVMVTIGIVQHNFKFDCNGNSWETSSNWIIVSCDRVEFVYSCNGLHLSLIYYPSGIQWL